MFRTKQTSVAAGLCCISPSKHRFPPMLLLSVLLPLLSISAANSATLPVKTFPVFSPETIAQLSHKTSINGLNTDGHRSINGPVNNNGQKESELAMNPMEVFPKQNALEMSMSSYPYDESAFDSDPDMFQTDNDDETLQLQEIAKRAPNKWQGLQGN